MDNIAEKMVDCYDYEVLSDIGFIKINEVMKTIPMKKYVVLFESGNIIECADKHKFISVYYNEIFCDDLIIGDLILSDDGIDEVFDVIETDDYDNMYDLCLDDHHLYYANGILSHNSNTISNFASRQVLHGYNVVLASMEMSEDAFAQRFDAIYSLQDINKIYTNKKELSVMMKSIKKIKKEALGRLYIKEFPTGITTTNDIRKYLRELVIRGVAPSIVYVDYINLMKPSYNNKSDLYRDNKGISEELRALGLEFDCPIVSVSQLNREGSMLSLKELDFTYIAESIGTVATADFVGIYGNNDDDMIYSSELWYKIVKNRLGGMVGTIDKFYLDTRSLKMYDNVELDQWISDAHISKDERKMAEIIDKPTKKRKKEYGKK